MPFAPCPPVRNANGKKRGIIDDWWMREGGMWCGVMGERWLSCRGVGWVMVREVEGWGGCVEWVSGGC